MEMDSHEERLHNMIQDSKREAAKEEAGRRAKELREKAKEAVRTPNTRWHLWMQLGGVHLSIHGTGSYLPYTWM